MVRWLMAAAMNSTIIYYHILSLPLRWKDIFSAYLSPSAISLTKPAMTRLFSWKAHRWLPVQLGGIKSARNRLLKLQMCCTIIKQRLASPLPREERWPLLALVDLLLTFWMTKVVSSLLLILNSYLCKLISSETIRILGSDNKASAEAREIQDDDAMMLREYAY